jgi:hypothetical protein
MKLTLGQMCIVYLLGFLDKAALNDANAYGLQADLSLRGNEYSWVAAISNFGYLIFAYPSTLILQKWPIGKYVSCMLMVWGALLLLTPAAKNFGGIMAIRFFLGYSLRGRVTERKRPS